MGLFDGGVVVLDAMVIINFGNLRFLDSFTKWAAGEVAVTIPVIREAKFCKDGPLNLYRYIKQGILIKEQVSAKEEFQLFQMYLQDGISGVEIHEGEASCLAVAITNSYGLASDEKVVRKEFKRVMPNNLCLTSKMIIERAGNRGYLDNQKVRQYVKGLFYL